MAQHFQFHEILFRQRLITDNIAKTLYLVNLVLIAQKNN